MCSAMTPPMQWKNVKCNRQLQTHAKVREEGPNGEDERKYRSEGSKSEGTKRR